MLTTAITALITGILTFFGIPPGPYIAGIWIGVKILVVATIALIAWRVSKRARQATPPPPPSPAP